MAQTINCIACGKQSTHPHAWEPSICPLCGCSLNARGQRVNTTKRGGKSPTVKFLVTPAIPSHWRNGEKSKC